MKGTFYGVSTGPGDPELITVRALRCLERVPVIAAPRTKGRNSMALEIVRGITDLSDKEILYLDFLMTKDPALLERSHRQLAEQVAGHLRAGKDVAMLNLGDASVYGTWGYLRDLVADEGYDVETIPGVPSFCAAAAALNASLTETGKPLTIIPGSFAGVPEALGWPGSKVLMKSASALPEVKRAIEDAGLTARTSAVSDCGLPEQKIIRDIGELNGTERYFTAILIGPENGPRGAK